jgi:uncharacterized protein (DUF488 family)
MDTARPVQVTEPSMIYTIGHSNHPIEQFLSLLQRHGITALGDVRSTPYSRFNPQFRREALQASLASVGIQYGFLGEELGARSRDPDVYDADGRVSYTKLARTALFQKGIERLRGGMGTFRIAIMCAEREPLDCHRTILVSRELVREGIEIQHILPDGTLEEHAHAIGRLVASLKLADADLFSSSEDVVERAYDARGAQMGYVKKG